jgi:hypothetical protein
MPALAVEDEQGMVDVLAVVAVVEGAFLISVSGIVGRVKVHEHPLRGTVLLPLREVKLEEDLGYPRWQELLVAAFSIREMVGWLARSGPLSGKEPQQSLSRGYSRRVSESF